MACAADPSFRLMYLADACAKEIHPEAYLTSEGRSSTTAEEDLPRDVALGSSAQSFSKCSSNSFNQVAYRKRKRGGRSGPNYRIAPGEPSAVSRAIQQSGSKRQSHVFYPAIGTTFSSCEEAKEFFNMYSWEVGFGIRCGKSRENDQHYMLWQILFVLVRTGCKVRVRLHRTEDHGWFISTFHSEHNHPLSEGYHENKQWKSHGEIDPSTKMFIKNLRENNVRLGTVCSILNNDANLSSMPEFRKGTLKSLCARLSQEKLRDDIRKTISVLEELKQSDPTLSVSLDIDHEGTIKNMLWCSGKNIVDYSLFGDVVTFDTTYRTNLYNMPFGLLVGVNNHFQTVVFAGVLMSHETTEAFEWVFSTFSRVMGNVRPTTILTDQAAAMETALKTTWPHSIHRWCRWHVLRNAKAKIGNKYSKHCAFKAKFNMLITEMMTAEVFEERWESLMKEYDLAENNFLNQIFKKRDKWAKPYFLDVFCAGMTSTQRSESANHMLKTHIPREAPMHLFVRKYNSFLVNRDSDEGKEKYVTKQRRRVYRINVPIERHAKEVYTRAMYEKFGDELFESGTFAIKRNYRNEEFIVQDAIKEGHEFSVNLNQDGTYIDCSCGMISHVGMPCRHALKVLVHLDKTEIPRLNILTRWTVKGGSIAFNEDAELKSDEICMGTESFMHNALWIAAKKIVENGKRNKSSFGAALSLLSNGGNMIEQLSGKTPDCNPSCSISNVCSSSPDYFNVYNGGRRLEEKNMNISCPPRRSRAGRPNSSSLKCYKKENKAPVKLTKKPTPKQAIAEVDEEVPYCRIKSLADV